MKEKYIFTYRSGPDWNSKSVSKQYTNASYAHQFAEGLRRGGALDVKYELVRRHHAKGK